MEAGLKSILSSLPISARYLTYNYWEAHEIQIRDNGGVEMRSHPKLRLAIRPPTTASRVVMQWAVHVGFRFRIG